MIRSITAITFEIDDVETAVEEIQLQITAGGGLMQNTAAILLCHGDFVETGVVGALGEALAFPVIGCTTTVIGTNRDAGNLMLSLLIYTSDTVRFTAGHTASLAGSDLDSKVSDTCAQLLLPHEKPALAMIFAPQIMENIPDHYIRLFSKSLPGVPLFGTLPTDDTLAYKKCFTIHNGKTFQDNMSLLFFYGDVKPTFYLATVSTKKLLPNVAKITQAQGNLLQEINGGNVLSFLSSVGLAYEGAVSPGIQSIPLLLDLHDEPLPVARVLVGMNKDGYGICGGEVPNEATMSIGISDKTDVVETTAEIVRQLVSERKGNSAFMLSCIGRNMALGVEPLAESDCIRSIMPQDFDFLFGHSGGEICPTQYDQTKLINQFHNYTFIACVL